MEGAFPSLPFPKVEVETDFFLLPQVGIWSSNRPEWQYVNQAVGAYSLTIVSLYDTLGADAVEFIANHASTRVVFASSLHIPELLKLVKSVPSIKAVVSLDAWTDIEAKGVKPSAKSRDAFKAWGETVGVKVLDIVERASSSYVVSQTSVSSF